MPCCHHITFCHTVPCLDSRFPLPLDLTIAGTTDSPTELTHLPMPREEDIKFILSEIKAYLSPNLSGLISIL